LVDFLEFIEHTRAMCQRKKYPQRGQAEVTFPELPMSAVWCRAMATSGTFLFGIMQEDVIRVYAYVPQDAAFGVAPGIHAVVRVPELPDRPFRGTVTRTADALQPGTRTLLTEVDIPNSDGALPPGIYCTVEFSIPRKRPSLSVPADAIIFNRNGVQVAVVDNGKAEIRKVTVMRDLGRGWKWTEPEFLTDQGDGA
jgi:multidrug efflux pump subunit AcrA (membrane-fusion protein)